MSHDAILAIGGSRDDLMHQAKVRGLAFRQLTAGDVIRIAWQNAPRRAPPVTLAKLTVSGMTCGLRVGRLWNMIVGLSWGYGGVLSGRFPRQPEPYPVWKLFRQLRTPAELDDLLSRLPPMAELPPVAALMPAPIASSAIA